MKLKKRTRYVLQIWGTFGWCSLCEYSHLRYIDNWIERHELNLDLLSDLNMIRVRRYEKYVRSR